MLRSRSIVAILALAVALTGCSEGGQSTGPLPPSNGQSEPVNAAAVATNSTSVAVPASHGVTSACYLVGFPANCIPVSNGGAIPYDAPLVLRLTSPPAGTTASVAPAAAVYAYGGVGKNSIAIRWRRTPGTMYTITSNGATFSITTASPVTMPAVPAHVPVAGRYCIMAHTWTLQYQAAKNALIDSAEQSAANAGATCARIEVQASYIWGGTTGNLNGTNADFSRYDYIATDLAQHGISMMPIVLQYGGSRIQSTIGSNRAFANARDYGSYAATVTRWIVRHNAQMAAKGLPQITRVELLNEPNQSYWFMDADTGAGIAAFLKAGYAAVKSVDRALFVFGPGLANGGSSHTNLFSDMKNMYAAGCKTGVCWDGISIHNYAWQMDPTVYYGPAFEGQWQNYRGVEAIASAHGDGAPKICLTETGFASDTSAWAEDPQVAARDMSLAYSTALKDPQISCIVNASLWDGDGGGGPYAAIGLGSIATGTFVPNPRYFAFKSFAK